MQSDLNVLLQAALMMPARVRDSNLSAITETVTH